MTELDLSRNSGNPTEGLHLFKITKVEEKASMSSGNPQLVLTCVCQDQGEDLGKNVGMFLSLSPAARFKIDELLDAVNAPKKGSWKIEQFVGKSFKAMVKYGEYEGRTTVNLTKLIPSDSKVTPQMPSTPQNIGTGIPDDSVDEPAPQKPLF